MAPTDPRTNIYSVMSRLCGDLNENMGELHREHDRVLRDIPDAFARVELVRAGRASVALCCSRIQERCAEASRGHGDEKYLLEIMRSNVRSIFSALDTLAPFVRGMRNEDMSRVQFHMKHIRLQTTFMMGYIDLV